MDIVKLLQQLAISPDFDNNFLNVIESKTEEIKNIFFMKNVEQLKLHISNKKIYTDAVRVVRI